MNFGQLHVRIGGRDDLHGLLGGARIVELQTPRIALDFGRVNLTQVEDSSGRDGVGFSIRRIVPGRNGRL